MHARLKVYLGPGLFGGNVPDSSYPEAAEPLREARDEDLRRLGWVGDGSTVVPRTCPMLHLYFGYGTVLILEYIHTLCTILYY